MCLKKHLALGQRSIEKQKKLLIKKIMSWTRQSFNNRNIGFYPFVLCTSIKPSVNQRCATLQSYPNQELWKALNSFEDQQLLQQIIEEVYQKTFKLKDKYNNSIIQEFQNRIKNNFDFFKFYKDTKLTNLDPDEAVSNSTEIIENYKIKQIQKNESESKSLLKQIELCNSNNGCVLNIEKQHYHKLCQLFDKINQIPINLQSYEMKNFKQQLLILLESFENSLQKKVCIQKQQQFETNPSNQPQSSGNLTIQLKSEILMKIREEALQMLPGLILYLPNYSQIKSDTMDCIRYIEEEFFKDLYFLKVMAPEDLTPQYIILYWRTQFEPQIQQLLNQEQNIKNE